MKVVPLDAPLGARIEGVLWQGASRPGRPPAPKPAPR